jgi:hypothetical protein
MTEDPFDDRFHTPRYSLSNVSLDSEGNHEHWPSLSVQIDFSHPVRASLSDVLFDCSDKHDAGDTGDHRLDLISA